MAEGVIMKALSGFYYVDDGASLTTCRGRGKLRREKNPPLVGDRVRFTPLGDGQGALEEVFPRKNQFTRPAVANVDQLVLVVSQAIPVTEPFLIDRVAAIAASRGCPSLVCINKCDLDPGEELKRIYRTAGFPVVRVSAVTGQGLEELRALLAGKISAFTGNSGVGKSSLLNALEPRMALATGEVSRKLGRGRHTTRHVELFHLAGGLAADTPGFSSFDLERSEVLRKEALAACFPDFAPYVDACRFLDCAHVKEAGCAVLEAVRQGKVQPTRHQSYVRLYEQAKSIPDWERT
ncbi:MAG: ribosome small subunit-dependent GTPase A [Lawsonibacter sp.]|nr:ribosome small subunit-dependent GTPase A [Lawsonibacter sp.]